MGNTYPTGNQEFKNLYNIDPKISSINFTIAIKLQPQLISSFLWKTREDTERWWQPIPGEQSKLIILVASLEYYLTVKS